MRPSPKGYTEEAKQLQLEIQEAQLKITARREQLANDTVITGVVQQLQQEDSGQSGSA